MIVAFCVVRQTKDFLGLNLESEIGFLRIRKVFRGKLAVFLVRDDKTQNHYAESDSQKKRCKQTLRSDL